MLNRSLAADPPPRLAAEGAVSHMLAQRLRSTRLTVLHGGTDDERSALLRDGLMPLLQRRADDSPIRFGSLRGRVLPFPERRHHAKASGHAVPAFEIAVLLDRWDGSPLLELQEAVGKLLCLSPHWVSAAGDTLQACLTALAQRFGARFLLLVDRCEDALHAAESNPDCARFFDQLAVMMRAPAAPAHVLLCTADRADHRTNAMLASYLQGSHGAELAWLRLQELRAAPHSPAHAARTPRQVIHLVPPIGAGSPETTSAATKATTTSTQAAEPVASADSRWMASLDDVLERVAHEARSSGTTAAPAHQQPAAQAIPPAEAPPEPMRPAVFAPPRFAIATVFASAAALTLAVGLWWAWPEADDRAALHTAAAAPPATAVPAPSSLPVTMPSTPPTSVAADATAAALRSPRLAATLPVPSLDLAVDADEGGLSQLADDLARIAPLGLRLAPSSGWADSVAEPRLALLRYDALEALNRQRPNAPLRLVAPLLIEELHFIARADSPLAHVHDIEGATINTGPADGSRALTARSVYQRLFSRSLPASQTSVVGRDAAMRQLLEARIVDVIVVADSQPSRWLASLPPAQAAAIKLLSLEPSHPASKRALRAYLPATLHAGSTAAASPTLASLGVMSFLVVAGSPRNAVTPTSAELGRLAQALDDGRTALERTGHPKWRDWQPGVYLPTPWKYVDQPAASSTARGTDHPLPS